MSESGSVQSGLREVELAGAYAGGIRLADVGLPDYPHGYRVR